MEDSTYCFRVWNLTACLDNNTKHLSQVQSLINMLQVTGQIKPLSNQTYDVTQALLNGLFFVLIANVSDRATNAVLRYEITPTWKLHHLHILMAITAALIVILNTYVISLFVRKKNLRKKSNLFLLSLTVSDELIGLIVIPFFITGQMIQGTKKVATWPIAQKYNHISFIFLTLCSFLCVSSLCAVTFDRCCHLCSPLKYQTKLTKSKVIAVLTAIWICCTVFALSSFIYYYPIYQYEVKDAGYLEILSMEKMMKKTVIPHYRYMLVLYSISIALSVVIAILLIKIFTLIIKSRRQASQTFHRKAKRREEIKCAVILTVMFGTIIIWLTPVFYHFLGQKTVENSIGMHLGRFVISIINPILFTLLKRDFWETMKQDTMKFITTLKATKKKFAGIQVKMVWNRNEWQLSSANNIESGTIRSIATYI